MFKASSVRLAPVTPVFILVVLAALVALGGNALGNQTPITPSIEVAAFGVQPSRSEIREPGRQVYPDYAGVPTATRVFHQDTWAKVLQRLNVSRPGQAMPGLDEMPELVPSKYVRLQRAADPAQSIIDYVVSAQEAYNIRILQKGILVQRVPPSADLLQSMQEDETKASLFAATDAAGLPEAIALQLAEIFADEVDFHRDLAKGYRCAIVFEMYYPDGMPTPGLILAAEFVSPTKHLRAFFHHDGNGEAGYFDPDGVDVNKTLRPAQPGQVEEPLEKVRVDLEKTFRRSPLEFSRITSAPAALRYHPILKEWRAHRGTDYGAPIGTKVLATGEGTVSFIGEKGGYGKLVSLRHFDRFTTHYGHLSGFAPGLKKGSPVRKGQVIGYVGMTGLATGPHLHYEFHAGATAADQPAPIPMVVRTVPAGQWASFAENRADHLRKLAYAQAVNLVMLE
jgi:murein DD-endopeptidase MepM/ murein hydrolase activator NlpD